MVRSYLFFAVALVSFFIVYRLMVPYLVSQKSDIALILGVVIGVFLYPMIAIYFGNKYYKSVKKNKEEIK